MSTILLKNVILNQNPTDVLIRGNRFEKIAPQIDFQADEIYDGGGHIAIVPPFYNTHTHAAMTLLRGYGEDMELFTWLSKCIWPAEAKLTGEDIYWGSRLAICEMIRSGTVFFNDMYWHQAATIKAVKESGIRAAIGLLTLSLASDEIRQQNKRNNAAFLEQRHELPETLQLTFAPHAIYTVETEELREVQAQAEEYGLPIHIHASETQKEVDDCMAQHNGMTPIAYLDSLGMLNDRTLLAHCVKLSGSDMELIARRRSVIAHMPCSNHKLASGRFRFDAAQKANCRITLGTDGASSNNSLSMFGEMKLAALAAKESANSPEAAKAQTVFDAATRNGAEAFGIDAGVIAEGKLADAQLIELDHPAMIADFDLTANLLYAADSSVVESLLCNGRFVMKHRIIPGEKEVLQAARKCCRKL